MREFDMHGRGHGRGFGRHRMGKGLVIGAVIFIVLGLLVMSLYRSQCGLRFSRLTNGNSIKIKTRNNADLFALLNQVIYSAGLILMLFKCPIPVIETTPIIKSANRSALLRVLIFMLFPFVSREKRKPH